MYDSRFEEGTYLSASDFFDSLSGPGPGPSSVMDKALELAAVVTEITAEYDVRNMTPHQIAEMARRLYLANAITIPEYAVLSFQPNLYTQFNYEAVTYQVMQRDAHRPRDFIAAWENHLEVIWRRHPDPASLHLSEQIVDLLQSFEPLDDEESSLI